MEHAVGDAVHDEATYVNVSRGRVLLPVYLERSHGRHAVRIDQCVDSSRQAEREHVYADRAERYSTPRIPAVLRVFLQRLALRQYSRLHGPGVLV